jgi:uncharacterized membrane protein YesL
MADFKAMGVKNFVPYLKEGWKASLMFAGFVVALLFILFFALPWYFTRGNFLGVAIAGLLFWSCVIAILAGQYFFPIFNRLETTLRNVPKKCLMLFFDNSFFTIVLVLGAVVLLILSSFTAFLFPGLATILLWYHVGVRLRLYKYDYLEAHPGANRKTIPWKTLFTEDQERIGPRTLRGMIFPWKG